MVKKIEAISQEQVKRLAKKIFIKRKAIEIAWAIMGILVISLVPFITGYFILGKESSFCGLFFADTAETAIYRPCEGDIFGRWFVGIFFIMIIGCLSYLIISLTYLWIKRNWEKSMEEAAECLLKQLKQ